MTELFLIAHKVRGEPAFDIAERHDDMGSASDPGPWWIIPTSGHRAYPWWWSALALLSLRDGEPGNSIDLRDFPMPPDLPDHYPARLSREAAVDLLAALRIPTPKLTVARRF